MTFEKPVGEAAGWHRKDTSFPLVRPWLKLRQDRVQIEGGPEIDYIYRESRGAVLIVPVMPDGNMVLIKQYRYAVDDWCMEIPAGGLHDREGVAAEDVAREELHEEAGATCEALVLISSTYSNNSTTDEVMHTYLATGVALHEYVQYEPTEQIEVVVMPAAQAIEMARSGEMKDALSALAILQCEPKMREMKLL